MKKLSWRDVCLCAKSLVLVSLCFFSLNICVKAQSSDDYWTIAFSREFSNNWGCYVFDIPKTGIGWGVIGIGVHGGSSPYRIIDEDFTATFTGGHKMADVANPWRSCDYGMKGYGTQRYSNYSEIIHASNKLGVTFSKPGYGKRIKIYGNYPQRLEITESGRKPVQIDLDPNPPDRAGGNITYQLSGRKITGLTVKSLRSDFAFSIVSLVIDQNSRFWPPRRANPQPPPKPNYCGVNAIARPVPSNESRFDWTMRAEVTERDGLVLSNVRLKGRLMAERISVPYYNLQTNLGATRGELRPNDSLGTAARSRLVDYAVEYNDERLIVRATYAIDTFAGGSQSCLNITQRYEFEREGIWGVCAPDPTGGHFSSGCSRWRAAVTYNFTGENREELRSLNVAQRNHIKVNGFSQNSVGLFLDCDITPPPFGPGCLPFAGAIFKNKLNPLFSEHYSVAISNGESTRTWDNVHQTYNGRITEPTEHLFNGFKPFIAGGCPECFHSHWRWGAHFTEDKFGKGKPLLPPGSNQDLSFAIVRYNPGEEHPNNLLDLISFTNPEPIRRSIPANSNPSNLYQAFTISEPLENVYWASATGHKNSDELFSHYGFFIGSEPNTPRAITEEALPSALSATQKDETMQSLSRDEQVLSSSQDAPTSIIYGFLYKDGATRHTVIDPSLVAQTPNGYVNYRNISYDIRTQALVSGPHTITFNLPSVTDQTTFSSLRVLHAEPDPFDPTRVIWVDRTILSPNTPAPNFNNRTISAKVSEVGPFLIARLTQPQTPNTNVADLSVSIAESADPITAGDDLIYTVNVRNNGTNMATGVVLHNGLSPDVSFVSASAGMRFCKEVNGNVICDIDMIAPGAAIPVTIIVKPNEGQTRFPNEGKAIINTAFVRGNESDPNESNNSATESTTALPNPNAPPTVKLTNPAQNALLSGPASISVVADAKDSDGTITQVEFFQDGESIGNGTLLESGYRGVTVNDVVFGEHTFIAVATDNGGRKSVSDAKTVFVNGPAVASLDDPLENALFTNPVNISLMATASVADGTISQVEFFADEQSLGVRDAPTTADQYNRTFAF